MESAIPEHLRCPRTRQSRASDDYAPPYPAWVARFKPAVTKVAMGHFGVQFRRAASEADAKEAICWLRGHFALAHGPQHHDLAHYVDEEGFDTFMLIAYWSDSSRFDTWLATPSLAHWWDSDDRRHGELGWFRELVCPEVARFETLFSTPDRFEGIGVLAQHRSDEIREHAYWGGARDRIPLSQTDALRPGGYPSVLSRAGRRVRVTPHENLALIRSGQEWTETVSPERNIYLEQVEPVLREGMAFLRDQGREVGCFANRYARHLDEDFRPVEKTFGMSYWHSLERMERWSESHPTHVAIFGTFMQMVQQMNFDLKLRLYHEVSVVPAADQHYEYINCHAKTGLLNVAA